ncbi:MAG TPA: 5-formyltetrahydrofolate cyclo-ligase [Pseudonocardia sp.]|uniref:5-formyltetrahydrofolate cyclo-ligase n=1 Tax=Pseudonocardia sp. TaxID=60912 RepID=UPI002F427303
MAEPSGTSPDRNASPGDGSGGRVPPRGPAGTEDGTSTSAGSAAPTQPTGKAGWRARLGAARRAVPAGVRATEAEALARAAVAAASTFPHGPVCCYLPLPSEPGSPAMLDALRAAGRQVLLPVVPPDRYAGEGPSALYWAPYLGTHALVDGPMGLRQPAEAWRGPAAVAEAALVLVPALAVDRRGVRLGRGAGWYDRTLPLARRGTPLVAVVRDEEVVEALPTEPHDVRMTHVLTPGHGWRAIRASPALLD